jgi:energy-coupling factor transport system permease protein
VHPLIRVLCFIVFAAWLALGGPSELACGFALLVAGYAAQRPVPLLPALRMLRRLRWFFLSLLVLYGWFTPDPAPWPNRTSALAALMPSPAGLAAGGERIAVLVAIVAGVNLLLRTTSREQMLAAIYGLALPLAPFGLRERLAVRMMLVIETLEGTRDLVTSRLAERGGLSGLRAAGALASELVIEVVRRAETGAGGVRLIAHRPAPPVQWLYPVILWLGFFVASRIGG